jgi:hypothetical protein
VTWTATSFPLPTSLGDEKRETASEPLIPKDLPLPAGHAPTLGAEKQNRCYSVANAAQPRSFNLAARVIFARHFQPTNAALDDLAECLYQLLTEDPAPPSGAQNSASTVPEPPCFRVREE